MNVKVTKRANLQSNAKVSTTNSAASAGGQEGSGAGGEDKEYMGVVSLVQLERHYGFIEVLDMDEWVFFHLSEIVPEPGNVNPSGESGAVGDTTEGETAADTGDANASRSPAKSPAKTRNKAMIKRGQEVAFHIGQRQGKPLGLRVRKLASGTLPKEESLPSRFVGVVVVAPRNVGSLDKDKVGATASNGLFPFPARIEETA